MTKIGNRVFTKTQRPDPELIEKFRGLPSSNINDEMNRLYCMNKYIRLLNPKSASAGMVGCAITVKAPIGDNLFLHQALDMAQPGDIIVVDGGTGQNRSFAGEIMMTFAQKKGLAGVVVDGCLRDWDGLENLTMPVYSAGITPQGPYKNGPGEVNTPVCCGGQVVFPGDILVGDRDGIVVIRPKDAPEILEAALAKKAGEDRTFELMDADLDTYRQKHIDSTASRFKGHEPVVVDDVYTNIYGE